MPRSYYDARTGPGPNTWVDVIWEKTEMTLKSLRCTAICECLRPHECATLIVRAMTFKVNSLGYQLKRLSWLPHNAAARTPQWKGRFSQRNRSFSRFLCIDVHSRFFPATPLPNKCQCSVLPDFFFSSPLFVSLSEVRLVGIFLEFTHIPLVL